MDVATLILLGAAGGLLRGALDLYTRFVSWQADRRAHRQWTAAGTAQGEAPQFQTYFDPAVDIAAAVVHSMMGAGAAVLFGTTGQISGEYAALVVGLSAPMLLTQLSRIQTVNEAVTGDRQPADAAAEASTPSSASAASVGGADSHGLLGVTAAAAVPSAALPRTEPQPSADPIRHPVPAENPPLPVRRRPSLRPSAAVADARTPEPASGEPAADQPRRSEPTRPGDTPSSAESADGTGSGFDSRDAPRWRQGPAIGEEGL